MGPGQYELKGALSGKGSTFRKSNQVLDLITSSNIKVGPGSYNSLHKLSQPLYKYSQNSVFSSQSNLNKYSNVKEDSTKEAE